jgi:hypothetical protein
LKATLLKIAAASAGAILMLCLLGTLALWYFSRPKPTPPWNEKALTTNEPPGFGVNDDDNSFYFSYTVQNAMSTDYVIENLQPKLLAVVSNGSLSNPIEEKRLTLRTPIFIPSHQKGTITVYLKALKAPEQKRDESDDLYHERLRQYLNDHVKGVQGFVVFDESSRYQINLPRWAADKPEKTRAQAGSRNP